jgi:hypothetical protein
LPYASSGKYPQKVLRERLSCLSRMNRSKFLKKKAKLPLPSSPYRFQCGALTIKDYLTNLSWGKNENTSSIFQYCFVVS